MLTTIVKTDAKKGTQRITIPIIIRKLKGWHNTAFYKIRVGDDRVVTIEEYLTDDDIKK